MPRFRCQRTFVLATIHCRIPSTPRDFHLAPPRGATSHIIYPASAHSCSPGALSIYLGLVITSRGLLSITFRTFIVPLDFWPLPDPLDMPSRTDPPLPFQSATLSSSRPQNSVEPQNGPPLPLAFPGYKRNTLERLQRAKRA